MRDNMIDSISSFSENTLQTTAFRPKLFVRPSAVCLSFYHDEVVFPFRGTSETESDQEVYILLISTDHLTPIIPVCLDIGKLSIGPLVAEYGKAGSYPIQVIVHRNESISRNSNALLFDPNRIPELCSKTR